MPRWRGWPPFSAANGSTASWRRSSPHGAQFYETLQSRAAALPGVRSAALVSSPPMGGGWDQLGFKIPGKTAPSTDGYFRAVFNIVSPDYFRTMAIPVRAGRVALRFD